MIVKHLDQILGTESDVDTAGWTSRRLILKDAGMGYSVHDTVIKAGAELEMHYKNHLETVYLTEGAGDETAILDVSGRNVRLSGSTLVIRSLDLEGRGTLERLPFTLKADVGGGTPVSFDGSGVYARRGEGQGL